MKTTGKVFLIIGILSFFGAAFGGNSVFGPSLFIALGIFLLYRANEKEEDKAKEITNIKTTKNVTERKPQTSKSHVQKSNVSSGDIEEPLTYKQKEAALCLIAFFSGYNDDVMYNDSIYALSLQASVFYGIKDYRETLTRAMPKYQNANILIDTVLTIKDRKSKEFLLLTCYDLTKMSGKDEAYNNLFNIAEEMGYDRNRMRQLIEQYSGS